MMQLDPSDLLSPSSIDRLARADGLTPEAAFDVLAVEAGKSEFQQVIQRFQSTPDGRALLTQQRRAWDREGLPCPWDCWLELGLVS